MSSIDSTIEVPKAAATAAAPTIDHNAPALGKDDRAEDDLLKFDTVEEPIPLAEAPTDEVKPLVELLVPVQLGRLTGNCSSNSLVEVALHESSDEELNEIEDAGMGRDLEDDEVDAAEHADHLSPLMMDNHTIVEHLECFQSSPSSSPTNELMAPILIADSTGKITIMKHSDTKDSLSSLDSDLGINFDRQRLRTISTEDSQGNSSSENDHSRDSGCETGPCIPTRPYCPVEADDGVVANDDEDLHEDDERPFERPNEEFSEKIVEQVEFYFSNESILKDAFLLKHVRRNKEGFVSLKLVSSFKRVRQLTKDWRVVGHAIQLKSKTVELNEGGNKVRRIEPLPSYDETMPSRTVVATDIPVEKITIEKAYEMFSKCGEIALVRILRVGGPIPADVRQFINKYPELLQKECALVEFVESKSARNALAYEGITVLEMVAPKKKTGKKAPVTRIMENHSQPTHMSFTGSPTGDQERSRGGAPVEHANNTAPRFQMRRMTPGYYSKPDQLIYVPPPRKFGYSHGNAFVNTPNTQGFSPVTAATHHQPQPVQYQQFQQPQPTFIPPVHHHHQQHNHVVHNQPQHFHVPQSPSPTTDSYEIYRRTSAGHIVAVTSSPVNKFNAAALELRRGSHPLTEMAPRKMHAQQPHSVVSPQPVHECQCQCQASAPMTAGRRHGNDLMFRRLSNASQPGGVVLAADPARKLSTGGAFERRVSVTSETNWRNENVAPVTATPTAERKYSVDHHQPESPMRKFSNSFDPLRKLSNVSDDYVNGRRISTDSGYDRKYSFSSDCSNSRSRSNSFICTHAPVIEQIIRAPQGPAGDGSRGFGTRTRKMGQILPPI